MMLPGSSRRTISKGGTWARSLPARPKAENLKPLTPRWRVHRQPFAIGFGKQFSLHARTKTSGARRSGQLLRAEPARNHESFHHRRDYIQSDEILKNLSAIGENSEPFPNIPEGTIWYNYTTTAFGTIFYGDSSGKAVDAEAKLHELANAVRSDVARMNEQTERVDIPWWAFAVSGVLFVLGVSLALFRRQKRPAPVHTLLPGLRADRLGADDARCRLLALFHAPPYSQHRAFADGTAASIDRLRIRGRSLQEHSTEGVRGCSHAALDGAVCGFR